MPKCLIILRALNRLLRLEYLGNSTYKVESALNSKVMPNDRFVTGCFIKGQPLYLPYLERDGEAQLCLWRDAMAVCQ